MIHEHSMEEVLESLTDVDNLLESHCLLVRQSLSIQVRDYFDEVQRTNIFHSRCLIQGKSCSFIIDSGSCANVMGSFLLDTLSLPCQNHPKPYYLQRLNESLEVKEKKYTLALLEPKDVRNNQLKMMKFYDVVKGKEKN
ncbi:hypothetical protein J1N35_040537 [Gossypium stocksii]|uniref:Uncharacterized protein n=1 Tax=Gossypium stocksii TaxID=47602 RepID=A0A9D3UDS3_9ROSI|nr:hypothetical protein J1N35_040537 [Gossypium stocksii]